MYFSLFRLYVHRSVSVFVDTLSSIALCSTPIRCLARHEQCLKSNLESFHDYRMKQASKQVSDYVMKQASLQYKENLEGVGVKGVFTFWEQNCSKYMFWSGDHYQNRIWTQNLRTFFCTDPFYIPWTIVKLLLTSWLAIGHRRRTWAASTTLSLLFTSQPDTFCKPIHVFQLSQQSLSLSLSLSTYIYIYIHIYVERERDVDRLMDNQIPALSCRSHKSQVLVPSRPRITDATNVELHVRMPYTWDLHAHLTWCLTSACSPVLW